jgi:hypothetical protein
MKLTLVVVSLLFAYVSCLNDEGSSFIVGGSDATIEDYPYMAGINNLGLASCGGSIINSRSVLTVRFVIITQHDSAEIIYLFQFRPRTASFSTPLHLFLFPLDHQDVVDKTDQHTEHFVSTFIQSTNTLKTRSASSMTWQSSELSRESLLEL